MYIHTLASLSCTSQYYLLEGQTGSGTFAKLANFPHETADHVAVCEWVFAMNAMDRASGIDTEPVTVICLVQGVCY